MHVGQGDWVRPGDLTEQVAIAVGAWDRREPRAREEYGGPAGDDGEDIGGVVKHEWVNGRIRTDNLRLMRPPL